MQAPDDPPATRRRTVLKATGTALLLGSLAGCSESADDGTTTTPTATTEPTTEPPSTTADPETTEDESGASGQATADVVVAVGPDGELVFDPGTERPLSITPGTEVLFRWESDNHSIVVDNAPDGSAWEGHETIENTGFTHRHTFETLGEYRFHCEPHQSVGMTGTIVITEDGQPPGTDTASEQTESDDPVRLGDDGTAAISVGADGDFVFAPGTERPVSVPPGTQVTFVWESDNHNVHMETMPEDATWTNEDAVVHDAGHERTHTFDVPGRYEFVCQPHESLGERGVLLVESTE